MQSAMLRCLEECDVAGARRLWGEIAPHLPQPRSDGETLVIIHHARSQCDAVRFKARAYSHRWLIDNGYPSGLPDKLKPKAERLYPQVVDAVGIACGSASEAMRPVALMVRGAMENVVLEHYADGVKDPVILKPRMLDARRRMIKQLLGSWHGVR